MLGFIYFVSFQLEQKYLSDFEDVRKIISVRGQDDVINRDLPLYEQAFRKRHFAVQAPPWYKSTYVENSTLLDANSKFWKQFLWLFIIQQGFCLCFDNFQRLVL